MKSSTIYLERNINPIEFTLEDIKKQLTRLHPSEDITKVVIVSYYPEEVFVSYKLAGYKLITFKEA